MMRLNQRAFLLNRAGQVFFQPVEFDLELADLLVELSLQVFSGSLARGCALRAGGGHGFQGLGAPLTNRIRRNAMFSSEFIAGFTAFDGVERNLGFKFGRVATARGCHCRISFTAV
jgi:hypothetical protein